VVVLGQRHPEDSHVSPIQLAATRDGGGREVVAGHSVHVARRDHRGEAVEEAVLRAAASHLGARTQHCCSWGSCSCCCYGGGSRGRSTSGSSNLRLDRLYVHHSGHRLTLDPLCHISEDVITGSHLLTSRKKDNYVRLTCHQKLAAKTVCSLEKEFASLGTVVVGVLPVPHFHQVQVVASLELKVCVLLSAHPLLCNCRLHFNCFLRRFVLASPSGLPFLSLSRLFLVLLCRISQGGSLHSYLW